MVLRLLSSRTHLPLIHIFYSILLIYLLLPAVIALPAQQTQIVSLTAPKPYYEVFLVILLAGLHRLTNIEVLNCPGSLPHGPYPEAPIYMSAVVDPITYLVRYLQYTDHWQRRETILEREGLCSRAGCKCTDDEIVCNNFDYIYFDLTIYSWYQFMCYSTCGCKRVGPGSSSTINITAEAKNETLYRIPNSTEVTEE